ncbi:MobA/MobL family protein [bacterium]|jgi:hypothetical protein|nr:MobA/MobL family protein [bacterium]
MAIFHLTVKTHGFGNDPKLNALRSYAYRSGTKIVDPVTGSIYNYTSKQSEVVLTETITPSEFIPDWMKDGVQLWRSLQTLEEGGRVDAQIFREIESSLPIELGLDEWTTIIRRFIREQLTSKGIIASFSVHLKVGNPHVHIMTTLRDIEGGMFLNKNRDWSRVSFVHELRESWTRHVNEALEGAGLDVRITHKSFADLGIEREASVHVGPVHLGKRNEAYKAKREARKQHNDRARVINSQRGKRRRHHARAYLTAGACAAKLGASLRSHPADVPLTIPSTQSPPQSSALSPADQAAYDTMHAALPDASRIYLELGRVKRGLGREWNWPSFLAQYKRLDKSGDILDALLAKELIWVVSRSPELAPELVTLVSPQRLVKAVQKAKAWAQAARPDRVPMLDSLMEVATSAMQATQVDSEADAETDSYADALAPLEYLVTNRAELIRQCQRVAHAIDRPLSPEVMAKRISRVVGSTKSPENQADLLDALITMEVVFAAKRRPHKVADVLDAVPPERRSHFEGVIASVLGTLPVDAGHDIAARALPHQTQMDMQAEFNVRQVLSEFQLSDFDNRRHAMAVIGKTYSWSDFQHDIQRQSGTDSGWQRAWWDEQLESLTGTTLASFLQTMPPWYVEPSSPKPTAYPMGAYDPDPDKTWLSALDAHRVKHPDMVDSDFTTSRTRSHETDHRDIRHEAVMARESILDRNADHPWVNGANGVGDGKSSGEGTASPNGW